MAQLVAIRALHRGNRIRVVNADGDKVTLSATENTTVDLDQPDNRRALAHHSAIGQWVVVQAIGDVQDQLDDLDGRVDVLENA